MKSDSCPMDIPYTLCWLRTRPTV